MTIRDIYGGVPYIVQGFKRYLVHSCYERNEKPFRTCKATVGRVDGFIYLRSYNTIVAFIDLRDEVLYDILRTENPCTPTSALHISKFSSDYSGYFKTIIRIRYNNNEAITEVLY